MNIDDCSFETAKIEKYIPCHTYAPEAVIELVPQEEAFGSFTSGFDLNTVLCSSATFYALHWDCGVCLN